MRSNILRSSSWLVNSFWHQYPSIVLLTFLSGSSKLHRIGSVFSLTFLNQTVTVSFYESKFFVFTISTTFTHSDGVPLCRFRPSSLLKVSKPVRPYSQAYIVLSEFLPRFGRNWVPFTYKQKIREIFLGLGSSNTNEVNIVRRILIEKCKQIRRTSDRRFISFFSILITHIRPRRPIKGVWTKCYVKKDCVI